MEMVINALVVYLIASLGFISLIWVKKGMRGISDPLIEGLFQRVVLLIIVGIAFAAWNFLVVTKLISVSNYVYMSLESLFLVLLFMAISNIAMSIKKIGDTYGFTVKIEHDSK
jgi:hypothetical protein